MSEERKGFLTGSFSKPPLSNEVLRSLEEAPERLVPPPDERAQDAPSDEPTPTGDIEQPMGELVMVAVEAVTYPETRTFDERVVEQLRGSLRKGPLVNPILITPDRALVAGRNRLEAFRRLGRSEIPARILPVGELDRQIAELDENLVRKSHSVLRRAQMLKKQKELYEQRHPETRAHVSGGHAKAAKTAGETLSFAPPYTEKAARDLGVHQRTIQEEVRIATDIDDEVQKRIVDSPLEDERVQLSELARVPKQVQAKVVDLLLDPDRPVKTVGQATRQLDVGEKPKAQKPPKLRAQARRFETSISELRARALRLKDQHVSELLGRLLIALHDAEKAANAWAESLANEAQSRDTRATTRRAKKTVRESTANRTVRTGGRR